MKMTPARPPGQGPREQAPAGKDSVSLQVDGGPAAGWAAVGDDSEMVQELCTEPALDGNPQRSGSRVDQLHVPWSACSSSRPKAKTPRQR